MIDVHDHRRVIGKGSTDRGQSIVTGVGGRAKGLHQPIGNHPGLVVGQVPVGQDVDPGITQKRFPCPVNVLNRDGFSGRQLGFVAPVPVDQGDRKRLHQLLVGRIQGLIVELANHVGLDELKGARVDLWGGRGTGHQVRQLRHGLAVAFGHQADAAERAVNVETQTGDSGRVGLGVQLFFDQSGDDSGGDGVVCVAIGIGRRQAQKDVRPRF